MAYGRFRKDGQCLILVNNNDFSIEKSIFVWELGTPKHGTMKALLWTDEDGYAMGEQSFEVIAGRIQIELPKHCAVILKYVETLA